MKIALFTQKQENLPQSYMWEGKQVATNAGIAFCQPFQLNRQSSINKIVIAFKDVLNTHDPKSSVAWEADIVAVTRSAPPFETWAGSPRYDIFYANARRLKVVPLRSRGAGYIRYINDTDDAGEA